MSKDIDTIKTELNASIKKIVISKENIDGMLETSKKLTLDAQEYKQEAIVVHNETKCIKPWMIYFLIVILVLFVTYTVFAFYLCGNFSVLCKSKFYNPDILYSS